MNILIIGKSQDSALAQQNEVLKGIGYENLLFIDKNKIPCVATISEGDTVTCVAESFVELLKDKSYNKVYIERHLNSTKVDEFFKNGISYDINKAIRFVDIEPLSIGNDYVNLELGTNYGKTMDDCVKAYKRGESDVFYLGIDEECSISSIGLNADDLKLIKVHIEDMLDYFSSNGIEL